MVDYGFSAKDLNRPKIQDALLLLRRGKADALEVSKLDRLSRSVLDFSTLLARSHEEGWALICLDLGVDTTTPTGRFVANLMANVVQLERELIGQRTREGMAALKRRGERLGRTVELPDAVRERIARLRDDGETLQAIADSLNEDGVPTAHGGRKWWTSTVRGVLKSVELDRDADAA